VCLSKERNFVSQHRYYSFIILLCFWAYQSLYFGMALIVLTILKGFKMQVKQILQYLKKNGQRTDWEIAAAIDLDLSMVRAALLDLSARGEISQCTVTRFHDGKPKEGMLCRIAGTIPPKAPGRKAAG
jgi:hypothetical protein